MKTNRKKILILASIVFAAGIISVSAYSAWFSVSNSFNVVADFSTSGTMGIALGSYTAPTTTPCSGGPSTFSCPAPTPDLLPGQSITYFTQVQTQLEGITPSVNISTSYTTYSLTTYYATMTGENGNINGPVVQGPVQLTPDVWYWVAITVSISANPTLGPVSWTLTMGA